MEYLSSDVYGKAKQDQMQNIVICELEVGPETKEPGTKHSNPFC